MKPCDNNDFYGIIIYIHFLGLKLKQALDFQLYQRVCDEQLAWISEVEKQLDSEDIGKDLQSVRFLIKKHEVLLLMPYMVTYIYIRVCSNLSLIYSCIEIK